MLLRPEMFVVGERSIRVKSQFKLHPRPRGVWREVRPGHVRDCAGSVFYGSISDSFVWCLRDGMTSEIDFYLDHHYSTWTLYVSTSQVFRRIPKVSVKDDVLEMSVRGRKFFSFPLKQFMS